MKYSAAVLAFAAGASAHMKLDFPTPYGSKGALQNGPLDPSGSNFPCRNTGQSFYDDSTPNSWNAGETKEVSFIGSAVHGGGSCQFSLTTDVPPTKDSQWKVIHSAIGNCPSDAEGNLPENAAGTGASKFPVTLPEDLPEGEYTFAWSWLNKIGNREFYMNCAPLTVGGSKKRDVGTEVAVRDVLVRDVASALGGLPDMYVANMGTGCITAEGEDFDYPNPGQSVATGTVKVNIASDMQEDSNCKQVNAMGAGNGELGSPAEAPDAPAASQAPASTQAPAATSAPAVPSNPGGVFAPGASSAPAAPSTVATSAAAAKPTGNPSNGSPSNGSPSNNTPTSGEGVPCDSDGSVVCIGSTQFGLCNQGMATPMDLASGTTCSNGVISKRSVKFPRAHLHRRHGSGVL